MFPLQRGRKICASPFICGKWETRSEVNRIHSTEDGGKIPGEGKEMGIIDTGCLQEKTSETCQQCPAIAEVTYGRARAREGQAGHVS